VISHLKEADSSVVSGLAPQAIMCAIGGKSNKQKVGAVLRKLGVRALVELPRRGNLRGLSAQALSS